MGSALLAQEEAEVVIKTEKLQTGNLLDPKVLTIRSHTSRKCGRHWSVNHFLLLQKNGFGPTVNQ